MKFIVFIQSYSQLEQIYGTGWRQICGTADCTIFSGGTNDSMTAKEISEACGVESIVVPGDSRSSKPGDGGTVNHHIDSRHLYTPDEIMRLPVGESIIKIVGKNPMRERLFHPSLRDFPEYLAFQKHIKEGWTVVDAANVAKKALSERGKVVTPSSAAPATRRNVKVPEMNLLKSLEKGFASLIGQETE